MSGAGAAADKALAALTGAVDTAEWKGSFEELCNSLNLDEELSAAAWQFLSQYPPRSQERLEENYKSACALYAASMTRQLRSVSGTVMAESYSPISLTSLVRACKCQLSEFFPSFKVFVRNMYLGERLEQTAEKLEKEFVVTTILFRKYAEHMAMLFVDNTAAAADAGDNASDDDQALTPASQGSVGGASGSEYSQLFRFGWILFLLAKPRLTNSLEIVALFHLLVCVLNFLVLHAPAHVRRDRLGTGPWSKAAASSQPPPTSSSSSSPEPAKKKRRVADGSKNTESDAAVDGDAPLDTLACLCSLLGNLSLKELQALNEKLLAPLLHSLVKESKTLMSDERARTTSELDGIATGPAFFPGACRGRLLRRNAQALSKHYDSKVFNQHGLDERVFLQETNRDDLATPSKISSAVRGYYHPRPSTRASRHRDLSREFESSTGVSVATPAPYPGVLDSPHPHATAAPPTPVSSSLELASWLRSGITGESVGLSDKLLELFHQTGDASIGQEIQARESELSARVTVLGSSEGQETSDWLVLNTTRRRMAVALYYRSLEKMLVVERSRMDNPAKLLVLLRSDAFHRALLACCFECALWSHKVRQMEFPAVLHLLDLNSFDFVKIIESFVRSQPTIPRMLINHLNSIEEQVLERMGWESDSALWRILEEPSNQEIVARMANMDGSQAEKPPSSADYSFLSPRKPPQKDGRSARARAATKSAANTVATTSATATTATAAAAATSSSTTASAPAEASAVPQASQGSSASSVGTRTSQQHPGSVQLYFRKVFYLAYLRLAELCGRLQLETHLLQQVWTCLSHVLTSELHLLRDRHLDQILMCCVYAVCRVNGLQHITFKRIITQYRQQPQAVGAVYRSVLLDRPNTGDIINFYNSVFVQCVKSFVLQFQQAGAAGSTAGLAPLPKLPSRSPAKVGHNFYLRSPSKPRGTDVAGRGYPPAGHSPMMLTPKTRVLYAVGESPGKELLAINRLVGGRKRPLEPPPVGQAPGGGAAARNQRMRTFAQHHPLAAETRQDPPRSPTATLAGVAANAPPASSSTAGR